MNLKEKSEKGSQNQKKLDKEIDEEAYKLYGITEEEKNIIGGLIQ